MKKTKDGKPINIRKLVRESINAMPIGHIFYGGDLKKICVKQYPELKHTYEETFIKTMRYVSREYVVCVDRMKSKYMKVEPKGMN